MSTGCLGAPSLTFLLLMDALLWETEAWVGPASALSDSYLQSSSLEQGENPMLSCTMPGLRRLDGEVGSSSGPCSWYPELILLHLCHIC